MKALFSVWINLSNAISHLFLLLFLHHFLLLSSWWKQKMSPFPRLCAGRRFHLAQGKPWLLSLPPNLCSCLANTSCKLLTLHRRNQRVQWVSQNLTAMFSCDFEVKYCISTFSYKSIKIVISYIPSNLLLSLKKENKQHFEQFNFIWRFNLRTKSLCFLIYVLGYKTIQFLKRNSIM